ncbi:MAG: hypothetical protein ABSE21_20145, partial [Bryobacteraceae bacterium]
RHGAHHCAMSMRMAAQRAEAASGKPILTVPSTCPLFPSYSNVPNAPVDALAAAPASLPALFPQAHSPAPGRAATHPNQIRTRAGRGPPATLPA